MYYTSATQFDIIACAKIYDVVSVKSNKAEGNLYRLYRQCS